MKPIQFPYVIELEAPKKPDQNGLILGDWKPYIPRTGTAGVHPTYGQVTFTPEMLEFFEKNFRNNNLGRPLWFNKNHKPGEAMLWIQDIRINRDENNIPQSIDYLPAYTPEGYEATQKDKKLRFLSPEFYRDYKNNGPTLAGGACTNDPFCVGKFLIELESGKNMLEKVPGNILKDVTSPLNEEGSNTLPGAPIPEVKKLSFKDPKELLETLDAISTHLSNDEAFKGKTGIKLIKGLYEPVKDMIKKHIEKTQGTPEPEATEDKEEMCGGGKDTMKLETDKKETKKVPENKDKETIKLENEGGNETMAETDEKLVKLENQIQEDRKIMLELAENYKKLSLENARKELMLEGIPKPVIDANIKIAQDNYDLKVKLENDKKEVKEMPILEACTQLARLYPKENKVPLVQLGDGVGMHSEVIDPQQQYNRMLISDAQKRADAKK